MSSAKEKKTPTVKVNNKKRRRVKSKKPRSVVEKVASSRNGSALDFKGLKALCDIGPTTHRWTSDDYDFLYLGRFIWSLVGKMEKGYEFTPGQYATYFRACFAWYLKSCGSWLNNDDNIPSCGNYVIPKGLDVWFYQNSSFKSVGGVMVYNSFSMSGDSLMNDETQAYYGDLGFDNTLIEPKTIANSDRVSLLDLDMVNMSLFIASYFPVVVKVCEIRKDAVSPELFCSDSGNSFFKVYPWSNLMSIGTFTPSLYGNFMRQSTDQNLRVLIWELLILSHHDQDTIAKVLKKNDYNPMMVTVMPIAIYGAFVAQIASYVFNLDSSASTEMLYPWIMLVWSYLGAHLSLVTTWVDIKRTPNYKLRSYKMPWAIQYLASQMQLKSGSTFYYFDDASFAFNWTYYYKTAVTTPYNVTTFNHAGFKSDSVPGDVLVAPGVIWAGPSDGAVFFFSWNYVAKTYDNMKAMPYLWNMATAKNKDIADCGCFADIQETYLADSYTNAILGVLSPMTVVTLYCGSYLTNAMCSIACALSVRIIFSTHAKYKTNSDASSDADVRKVIDYSMGNGLTNMSTIQAALTKGSINSYVIDALSENSEPYRIEHAAIKKWLLEMVSSSSVVKAVGEAGREAILKNAPSRITGEWVASAAGSVGMAGIGALASFLAGKLIWLSGRRVDEL